MNKFHKILFWSATILLGFVNPLISVALIVLYYLPKIISDLIQSCGDADHNFRIKSYSDEVLEEMK